MTKWLLLAMIGLTLAVGAPVWAFQQATPELFHTPVLVATNIPVAMDAGPQTQTPATVTNGPNEDAILTVVRAARAGKWLVVIGGILSLIVTILKYAAKAGGIGFFHTDRGGAILVGTTSLFGALATTWLAPGANFDWSTILAALAVTWTAAGGYSWIKKLLWPAPKDELQKLG